MDDASLKGAIDARPAGSCGAATVVAHLSSTCVVNAGHYFYRSLAYAEAAKAGSDKRKCRAAKRKAAGAGVDDSDDDDTPMAHDDDPPLSAPRTKRRKLLQPESAAEGDDNDACDHNDADHG